jgi:hypothetical protein
MSLNNAQRRDGEAGVKSTRGRALPQARLDLHFSLV